MYLLSAELSKLQNVVYKVDWRAHVYDLYCREREANDNNS